MKRAMAAALAALALMASLAAEAQLNHGAKPDRGAIEKIVRDYLLKNPEVIEEAIGALRAKRQEEERRRAAAAIARNGETLRAHPLSPVSGNAEGDVTVVEFFDYQCGYCKRALPAMDGAAGGGRECARRLEGVPDPGARLPSSPPALRWRRTGRADTTPSTSH